MLPMTDQEKRAITVCFTGHRVLPAGSYEAIMKAVKRTLMTLHDQGYRHFVAGGALGFDTLAALAVLAARDYYKDITLELCLPCRDQADGWGDEDRALYESIKERSDGYVILAEHYYNGCMQRRNRALVDQSSLCVAYLTSTSDNGGTVTTVRYANKKGLQVINVAQLL